MYLGGSWRRLRKRAYCEPTAKLQRVVDDDVVCVFNRPSVIVIPKSAKIRVPLLRKKKWHKVGHDDNNNNNRDMYIYPRGGMN